MLFPGIVANLDETELVFLAISSAKLTIFDTFIPDAGSNSYKLTTGPLLIALIFPSIPKSKRIYLHGCGDINEVWNVTERPELHSSKAIRLMGEKALSMAKWNIDEIDFFDLYSCFPSMVELGREALDISENITKC